MLILIIGWLCQLMDISLVGTIYYDRAIWNLNGLVLN